MRIRYLGHIGHTSGYANAGCDYLLALYRAGVDLDIWLRKDADANRIEPRFQELLSRIHISATDKISADQTIVHVVPPQAEEWFLEGIAPSQSTLLTTWETSKLPQAIVDSLHSGVLADCENIVVPCDWNRETFTNAKNDIPIVTMPHTFDPDWWFVPKTPKKTPLYTFYWIGTWSERKNPLGFLKAYLTEFTSRDNVLAKMVLSGYNYDELGSLVRAIGRTDLPLVEFVGTAPNRLSDEQLREVHLTSDCYVTLARGEGWGLGAFEAALVGNPVIAPKYGGFLDFLSHYAATRWVPCCETPAITPLTVSATKIPCGDKFIRPILLNAPSGIYGDQLWAEPDIDTCKKYMRQAYLDGTTVHTASREALITRFGYKAVAAKFKALLGAV